MSRILGKFLVAAALSTALVFAGCSGPPTDGATSADGGCVPTCGDSRDCCDGECVNLANDPRHCGGCQDPCSADTYCGGGMCIPPPCTAMCGAGVTCCGGECCAPGQLCCDPQGPVGTDPTCTDPDDRGTCPSGCAPLCICASPDTPIATPDGNRAIASLRVGDLVYSIDRGALVAVPVVRTNRTPVSGHHVVRVALETGAILEISAGHPTADGRTFADLDAGLMLGDLQIMSLATIPYEHPYTYDILPASDTGTYIAGGALIGSTLAEPAAGR